MTNDGSVRDITPHSVAADCDEAYGSADRNVARRGVPVGFRRMEHHEHQLSQPAFDRLKAELEELTTIGRINIARKIEVAREMGDLSENGDYHAAKEEQGKMEARIGHLAGLVERSVIISDDGEPDAVVQGVVVTLVYEGDDDEEEQYLIGSIEERRDGVEVVSPTSPLGAALLGRRPGDEVTFEAPNGELTVVIIRLHR